MTPDILIAEIGSTTTSVSACGGLGTDSPRFLGLGFAPTSVNEGDVSIGLEAALSQLKERFPSPLKWDRFYASSSAAGGLRMTVHGLVLDMTVRAAKEAALGAGANIQFITAGRLGEFDLHKIVRTRPQIIMIAGGVDYGETETALENARRLSALMTDNDITCPVLYAGNCQNREEIEFIFHKASQPVYLTENVYPAIDELNVDAARLVIQDIFEEHITHAPGMDRIRDKVDGHIMPTPGAVMQAARLMNENSVDLMVLDTGGATTDIHSVCEESDAITRIQTSPQPHARRTVEGDMGIYVNRLEVQKVSLLTIDKTAVENLPPVPFDNKEKETAALLTEEALRISLNRHAGTIRKLYGPAGAVKVASGKDLSRVSLILGTGGALTRLPEGREIIQRAVQRMDPDRLKPSEEARILLDREYITAPMGVISRDFPGEAWTMLKNSYGL